MFPFLLSLVCCLLLVTCCITSGSRFVGAVVLRLKGSAAGIPAEFQNVFGSGLQSFQDFVQTLSKRFTHSSFRHKIG